MRDQWRLSEDRADTLLAAWEAEAASLGLPRLADGYWSAAELWLSNEGEARRGAARPLATDPMPTSDVPGACSRAGLCLPSCDP